MELENITLITNKKGVQKIKITVQKLENVIPNLFLGKLRYGEIQDKILISFRVSKDHLTTVIEKLIYNGIKILPTSDEIKEIISEKKDEYKTKLVQSAPGWNETKARAKKPVVTISQLEEMVDEGNYQNIMKISKDMINYGQDLVDRAQKVLYQSVSNAIEKAYTEGQTNENKAAESITELIRIASEPLLRTMQKTDLIKEAGLYAVELCKAFPKLHDELIKIANNNKIHNIINVKAVIAFAELLQTQESENNELLDYAVKEINLRWLSIALDVAQTTLTKQELDLYNNLISSIQNKRVGRTDS